MKEAHLQLQAAWDTVVDMQQGEGPKKLTDVHLICADGLVPAHTCILADVSPWLRQVFVSQGLDYFGVRSVLLPEHPVTEIERMIQLIYYGSVDVSCEADANSLKRVLQEFQISNIDKLKFEIQEWPESELDSEAVHVLYYVYKSEPDPIAQPKSKVVTSEKSKPGTSSDAGVAPAPPLPLNPSGNGTSNGGQPVKPDSQRGNESDDDIIEVEVISVKKTPAVGKALITVPDDDVEMGKESKSETPAVTDVQAIKKVVADHEDSQVISDLDLETTNPGKQAGVGRRQLEPSVIPTNSEKNAPGPGGPGSKKAGKSKANREISPHVPLNKRSRSSSPASDSTTKSTRSSSVNISPTSNRLDSASGTRSTRSGSANVPSPTKPNLPAQEVNTESEAKKMRSTRKSNPVTGNVPAAATKESTPPDSGKKSSTPQPQKSGSKPVRELRSRGNRKRIYASSDEDFDDEEAVSDDPNYDYDTTSRRNSRQARKRPANNSTLPIPKSGTNQSPSTAMAHPTPMQTPEADSESEYDDLEPAFYKDSKRIFHEAKLCRGCNKLYGNPREASDCITEKHKLVRCYFCFNVFKNTEKLFEHYASRHRKAGRENNVICPYCQGTIAHRSISTHVISNHIFDAAFAASAATGPAAGKTNTARSSTGKGKNSIRGMHLLREERPGQSAASGLEEDDDLISNGLVMKKKSNDGNVRVFVLDKDNTKK